MLRTALLLVVVLAGPAAAWDQCDGHADCFGLYFDGGVFEEECLDYVGPFIPLNVYFVVKDCAAATFEGFEFAWRLEPTPVPAPVVLEVALPAGAPEITDPYNVSVRLAEPLPVAGPVVLATTTLMFLAQVWYNTLVYVGPSSPASLPGPILIGDGEPRLLYIGEAVNDEGWGLNPVAGLNAPCHGDPVELTTWGGVKALYR